MTGTTTLTRPPRQPDDCRETVIVSVSTGSFDVGTALPSDADDVHYLRVAREQIGECSRVMLVPVSREGCPKIT